jgi:hypothetical protein
MDYELLAATPVTDGIGAIIDEFRRRIAWTLEIPAEVLRGGDSPAGLKANMPNDTTTGGNRCRDCSR